MKLSAHNEKNLVYLLVVIFSLFLFLVYYQNQSYITESNLQSAFTIRAAIAAGLMVFLMFIISNRNDKTSGKKSSKRRR